MLGRRRLAPAHRRDQTDDLAVPGIVTVVWPGGPAPSPANVASAAGQELRLADVRAASGFTGGDLVWLQAGDGGELATVAGVRARW